MWRIQPSYSTVVHEPEHKKGRGYCGPRVVCEYEFRCRAHPLLFQYLGAPLRWTVFQRIILIYARSWNAQRTNSLTTWGEDTAASEADPTFSSITSNTDKYTTGVILVTLEELEDSYLIWIRSSRVHLASVSIVDSLRTSRRALETLPATSAVQPLLLRLQSPTRTSRYPSKLSPLNEIEEILCNMLRGCREMFSL